jgi:hypothetical protein
LKAWGRGRECSWSEEWWRDDYCFLCLLYELPSTEEEDEDEDEEDEEEEFMPSL